MAVAKWNTPSAVGSNIAGTTLNSLADGSTSAFVTHDNSTNLDLQASVAVLLGSFTSVAGATITLRAYSAQSTNIPDNTGSVGGGDTYTQPITVGASAKVVVFPLVRLYPESMRLQITNNAGAAFAAASNQILVRPYNENVT
jgi:hypothetical protein